MDHVIYLYVVAVLLAAALAGIAIWSPRSVLIKVVSISLAALMMPTAYASLVDLLGKPKPVSMEWAKQAVPEATVLGASMREDQAIFLWLQFDGTAEPRAYVLPWNMEHAKGLQEALRRAEADGTSVRMRRPFDSDTTRREPLFYAEPRPALPPKMDSAG